MSAEIIEFAKRGAPLESRGNGAHEALVEIAQDCPFHVEHGFAGNWADDVIMTLWVRGFKIAPLDD